MPTYTMKTIETTAKCLQQSGWICALFFSLCVFPMKQEQATQRREDVILYGLFSRGESQQKCLLFTPLTLSADILYYSQISKGMLCLKIKCQSSTALRHALSVTGKEYCPQGNFPWYFQLLFGWCGTKVSICILVQAEYTEKEYWTIRTGNQMM